MTQLAWWLLFIAYGAILVLAIYLVGGVVDGIAYWLIGGAMSVVGLVGSAYISRLRIKAGMRESDSR